MRKRSRRARAAACVRNRLRRDHVQAITEMTIRCHPSLLALLLLQLLCQLIVVTVPLLVSSLRVRKRLRRDHVHAATMVPLGRTERAGYCVRTTAFWAQNHMFYCIFGISTGLDVHTSPRLRCTHKSKAELPQKSKAELPERRC